jgi:hypothetical protein
MGLPPSMAPRRAMQMPPIHPVMPQQEHSSEHLKHRKIKSPQPTHLRCLLCRYRCATSRKLLRWYSPVDADPRTRLANHTRAFALEHPRRTSTPIEALVKKESCVRSQTLGRELAGTATLSTTTTGRWIDSVRISKNSSNEAPNVACKQR